MADPSDTPQKRSSLSRRKKFLFAFLTTIALMIVLEGVMTLCGVRPLYYEQDPFVGFAGWSPLFEQEVLPDGTTRYTTSPNKLNLFNKQSFSKHKGPNTVRIFCLGGSTTFGRPYDDTTSFVGWLREFAAAADPERTYEVVNAGGVSYASYRVARLMEDLVEYEPDLFIVYTGHNEFLEHRTYGEIRSMPESLRNLASLLSRTRIYSATSRLFNSPPESQESQSLHETILTSDIDAILDRTVGPESYKRDEKFQSQVLAHFDLSLHRIIDIAATCGAELIFIEPASNLKDCTPFKSQHTAGLSEDDLQRVRTLLGEAEIAHDSGKLESALELIDRALKIDNRFAVLHFQRGRLLLEMGKSREAKNAFVRARDEDVCPLRAISSIQDTLKTVADESDIRLVPYPAILETRSKTKIPGADLFLDHVHPTIEGNSLLGRLLVDELITMNLIDPVGSWNKSTEEAISRRILGKLDRRDHALALRKLSQVLGWAGKFEDADRLALRAVETLSDDATAQYLAGMACERQKIYDQAIAHYQQATRLDASHWLAFYNLGNILFSKGEFQSATENYQQSIRANPQFARAHQNLGATQLRLGNTARAIECFHQALDADPNLFEAHMSLSQIYFERGHQAEAQKHLQRANLIRPSDPALRQY